MKLLKNASGWPTFAYMNILNMRAMILCNRNEKIINQKFVLLKVASDKKFVRFIKIVCMKTGAIKVCRGQDVSKPYFKVKLET
jgi:hypothetical protein